MSSISINASDQGLAQFFRKLSSSTASGSVAAPAATTASASVASVSDTTTSDGNGVQGASGHHHGHGGLFKKVEAAVNSALEAAKSDPNADPNKVVEDAIAKVFKDSGVTPPGGAGNASGGAKSANDPDGDGDQDAAGKADSDVSSARQAFTQTLQAFGVSASQFHTDFLAAIKDVQGGGSDSAGSLFKTFPPGSSVDTTA